MTTTTGPTQPALPTAATYQPMRGGAAALAAILEEVPHVPVFAAIVNDDEGDGRPSVVLDVHSYADGVRAATALGLILSRVGLAGHGVTEWRSTALAAGAPTDVIVRAYSEGAYGEGVSGRRAVATLARLLIAAAFIIPAALALGHMIAEAGGAAALMIAWIGCIIAPPSVAGVRASLRTLRRRGGAR